MSRTRAALAAVVLLALALGGCTDDDPDPQPAPPPSSSEPASPSTSAAADTPEATVRAWVAAQNEALASGDSSAVRALSAANCRSCDGLIDPIDEVFAAGGRFDTNGWAVDRAKQTRAGVGSATVTAAVTIAAGRTYNSAHADPVVYEVERSIVQFRLIQVSGRWLVAFVGFLS